MKRYTRKFQVEIGELQTYVHTETESRAIDRAVTKLFGNDCFWFPSSGLPGYGQVFRALRPTKYNSNPGNSSLTAQTRLRVTPIGKPSSKFLAQQKQDAIDDAEATAAAQKDDQRHFDAYMDGRMGRPRPTDKYLLNDWLEGQEETEMEKQKLQYEE